MTRQNCCLYVTLFKNPLNLYIHQIVLLCFNTLSVADKFPGVHSYVNFQHYNYYSPLEFIFPSSYYTSMFTFPFIVGIHLLIFISVEISKHFSRDLNKCYKHYTDKIQFLLHSIVFALYIIAVQILHTSKPSFCISFC